MADRPGKKMAEYAVKQSIAESMLKEAPDDYTRSQISNRAAQAGREAEAEVKREMRGKKAGGKVKLTSKKPKRYADGGLAGIADSANALMGEVDGFANRLNYGDATATGPTQKPGFLSLRKGGKVKTSGYRKVADGIATKGKTKGRMV